jgi:hypothetical protein
MFFACGLSAYKFFLYTLAGSVLFLLAVLYLYFTFNTTDIPTLMSQAPSMGLETQKWLWLALFASFAVKVPMWPVHTWLPDAHVQAPTAGSVILAGILLKLGAYGFLRFSLPMLPDASHYFADFVFVLSVIAVVYTSLVALVQEEFIRRIDAVLATPDADNEVHGDEHRLEEEIEQKQVERHKRADDQRFENKEQRHEFTHALVDGFPAARHANRHQEGGQQHQPQRDPINSQVVINIIPCEPRCFFSELEVGA